MEYLIFIELGLFTIVAGIVYWVMRNLKKEKEKSAKTNKD